MNKGVKYPGWLGAKSTFEPPDNETNGVDWSTGRDVADSALNKDNALSVGTKSRALCDMFGYSRPRLRTAFIVIHRGFAHHPLFKCCLLVFI